MTYAVISDIHANASALRKALADAWKEGATHIVCLGDVVGYGPEPARTVAMLRVEKATIVAGNHDDAVSGRADAADFVDLAADAVSRHKAALRDDEKEWLGALPYIANLEGNAVCVHGDLTAPREFRYIEDTADAAANFAVCDNQLIFVGHTHTPCLFITGGSGKTYKTAPQDFTVEPGKRYIVNPGSVGYPREENGSCVSSYVLYDSDRHEVRFRFLPFSVSSVMQRGPADTPVAKSSACAPSSPRADTAAARERRIAVLAICAMTVIFAATIGFVLLERHRDARRDAPQGNIETVDRANVEVPNPSKPVKKTLFLMGNEKFVRANVYPAANSSPVVLSVDFLTQSGAIVSTKKTKSFKKQNTAKFNVPHDVHRVEFTVTPKNPGDFIKIIRFEPSAE